MKEAKYPIIDHLFRHQYGKMMAALTRIFGSSNLEIIEDAVQDTFIKAMIAWREGIPENPERWLMTAAKNRAIDIFRKLKADEKRVLKISSGAIAIKIEELFLESEIEDAQLRMIFMACHPALNAQDQLAFALKTISGFSAKEIASALLVKEETVKKRLVRARKSIADLNIAFEIPQRADLPIRLNRVLEVLYLIFNEGFHSGRKEILVRKELCSEAMRLCQMLLQNQFTKMPNAYVLMGLMCFHAARLETKVNDQNEIVDLKNQDRSKWFKPLIILGNEFMNKAVENGKYSTFHYEAAIASEHLKAKTFHETDWKQIHNFYEQLYGLQPSAFNLLNIAFVKMQLGELEQAFEILMNMHPKNLEQRAYLFHGTIAEYHLLKNEKEKAIASLNEALKLVKNEAERIYLERKQAAIKNQEPSVTKP